MVAKTETYPWAGNSEPVGTQATAPIEGIVLVTSRMVAEAYEMALEAADVTLAESAMLAYVDSRKGATQIEIAQAVYASRATTGVRLDSLERRGLIKRKDDISDRRVWRISLTASGRRTVAKIIKIDNALCKVLQAGLSHDVVDRLSESLQKIHHNVSAFRVNGSAAKPSRTPRRSARERETAHQPARKSVRSEHS